MSDKIEEIKKMLAKADALQARVKEMIAEEETKVEVVAGAEATDKQPQTLQEAMERFSKEGGKLTLISYESW